METAVLLITFNRLDYVQETLAAIARAKPPRLYLASDGPRPNKPKEKEKVEAVRKYLLSHIDWPCQIYKRFLETNSGGCKYGVSGAVSWFFENESEGIILEDDCVPNPSFFNYCETLLKKYRFQKDVWHIAGDAPIKVDSKDSYYFAKIQHCWGWASWADRWKYFSLDAHRYTEKDIKKFSKDKSVQNYWRKILHDLKKNLIDSWAYLWTFVIVSHKGLCINPTRNLISNIGEYGLHFNGEDSELSKETEEIALLKHPKRKKWNNKFVKRIYIEKFGIKPDPFFEDCDVLEEELPEKIKLSIITICYNEKQIERTCQSIVNQTWQDFEWIVVDGGSTDGTLDILKKYQDRIDILISEPDKGLYNAMNKGIKLAKGQYLNFMNGGDAFYQKNVLEKVFKNTSYSGDILYGDCVASDSKNRMMLHFPEVNMAFYRQHTINHQASFIKRKLFEKYGLYNENYKIGSDCEKFLIFLQKRATFQYIPIVISLYDLSGISSTKVKESLTETKKMRSLLIKHKKRYNFTLFNFLHFVKQKFLAN